jgi:phosphoglycolate phosphatase
MPWLEAVWFDLDGTLVDSARDLALPIHAMRAERGLAPLSDEVLRPFTSQGARGLLARGLGIQKEDPGYEVLREDFLARYEASMVIHTDLFPGMGEVLGFIEEQELPWGVVTNKFERYARRILTELGLAQRCVAIVGGDATAFPKPHPAHLFYACGAAWVDPRRCVYVGDDLRDVQAGRGAGMLTVAAAYGFCGDDLPIGQWGADALIHSPVELIGWIARGSLGQSRGTLPAAGRL